jgi:hypothetical protein
MITKAIITAIKTILVAIGLGTFIGLAYIATQQEKAQRIEPGHSDALSSSISDEQRATHETIQSEQSSKKAK